MGDPDKSYFQDLAKQVKEGECMRLRIQLIKDESTKRLALLEREKRESLARLEVNCVHDLHLSPDKRPAVKPAGKPGAALTPESDHLRPSASRDAKFPHPIRNDSVENYQGLSRSPQSFVTKVPTPVSSTARSEEMSLGHSGPYGSEPADLVDNIEDDPTLAFLRAASYSMGSVAQQVGASSPPYTFLPRPPILVEATERELKTEGLREAFRTTWQQDDRNKSSVTMTASPFVPTCPLSTGDDRSSNANPKHHLRNASVNTDVSVGAHDGSSLQASPARADSTRAQNVASTHSTSYSSDLLRPHFGEVEGAPRARDSWLTEDPLSISGRAGNPQRSPLPQTPPASTTLRGQSRYGSLASPPRARAASAAASVRVASPSFSPLGSRRSTRVDDLSRLSPDLEPPRIGTSSDVGSSRETWQGPVRALRESDRSIFDDDMDHQEFLSSSESRFVGQSNAAPSAVRGDTPSPRPHVDLTVVSRHLGHTAANLSAPFLSPKPRPTPQFSRPNVTISPGGSLFSFVIHAASPVPHVAAQQPAARQWLRAEPPDTLHNPGFENSRERQPDHFESGQYKGSGPPKQVGGDFVSASPLRSRVISSMRDEIELPNETKWVQPTTRGETSEGAAITSREKQDIDSKEMDDATMDKLFSKVLQEHSRLVKLGLAPSLTT
mmetsp:Transcript_16596/g.38433  ORF Transcript_16596/g.38433 Transcript_16596/m.38433 type:complete len:667 (-) Transcript_16596:533-2533(-)